jgi:hypothetical protein
MHPTDPMNQSPPRCIGSPLGLRYTRRQLALGAAALAAGAAIPAQAAPAEIVEITPPPISDPASYDAYIPTACKNGPFYIYTCEFDASWAIFKTFGIDAQIEDQVAAIDIDDRLEPYYAESANGFVIYGGDITRAYSGDYTHNFLARTTGGGFRRVFTHYGLRAVKVHTRERIQEHLRKGRLIWIKMTVDFLDWRTATWITPEGKQFDVVFSNDHAAVVIGYNDRVAVVRDVLGPTSTNDDRLYEYEVPWETFMRCWGAQSYDGLAVSLD